MQVLSMPISVGSTVDNLGCASVQMLSSKIRCVYFFAAEVLDLQPQKTRNAINTNDNPNDE